jgi:uncharacterized glyoxalase superfamily metalloenzyme YdcJ
MNIMTTATFTSSAGIPVSSTQAKQVPAFSLRDLFDVFTSSLAMVRALPDSGRINAKDLEKVRLIADTL